jgi:4-hydroxy-4-methyl-2-oxoglutarate aldolase
MARQITDALLQQLREFDSPTISNAIELLSLRDVTEGFSSMELRCAFPDLKPMVGYAVTCTADSTSPGQRKPDRGLNELFDHIIAAEKPIVVIIQNCGPNIARSCFIGDMIAVAYQKLGCVGAVTDGGHRDLSGVRKKAPGFQLFSRGAVVSHGSATFVDVGIPVTVGGLTVNPGDLLHGDESGLVTVPINSIESVLQKARLVQDAENEWVKYTQSASFKMEEFRERFLH